MFQLWDKQVRTWLVGEIRHWHRGDLAIEKVWSVDFGKIGDLLESFNWDLKGTGFYQKLDECRLVVNVFKHGDGKSLTELKSRCPRYFLDPSSISPGQQPDMRYRDHTHLEVSDTDIEAFSAAIVEFWQAVPDDVLSSQMAAVPDWFGNTILKDRKP